MNYKRWSWLEGTAEIQATVVLFVTTKVNLKGTANLVSYPLHITTVSYHHMLRDKILKIPQLAVRPWIYKTWRKILNFPHLARKILNFQHLAAKFLILLKEDPNSWKCFENETQSLQQRAWIKPPCETHFKRGET